MSNMSEATTTSPADWRGPFSQSFLTAYLKCSQLSTAWLPTGESQARIDELVNLINPESLVPFSILERLDGISQHTPAAQITGAGLSRGQQHTRDVMGESAHLLTRLFVQNEEYFRELSKDYHNDPIEAIRHCIAYLGLHDGATLAFQDAIQGLDYDEDKALIGAFADDEKYAPISALLFNNDVRNFYREKNIDLNLVMRIAKEANSKDPQNNSVLPRILKDGRKVSPSIDWISYLNRDFWSLAQAMQIQGLTTLATAVGLQRKLSEISEALRRNVSLNWVPQMISEYPPIEQIVPLDFMRLEKINGQIVPVYDVQTILEFYVQHLLLRFYFSGSDWLRGSEKAISDYYLPRYQQTDELVRRLLLTEDKLLAEDLAEIFPPGSLVPENLAHVDKFPASVKGWQYSDIPDGQPVRFVLYNLGQTRVEADGEIKHFSEVYPDIMKLIEEKQPPLYLHQNI